jgi:hypothetical protein
MNSSRSIVCPYCINDEFTAPSEALLSSHIRLVHSLDPGFSIQCILNGCSRTFKNFRTYQNHRSTTHATRSASLPEPDEIENGHDYEPMDENYEMEPDSVTEATDMTSFAAKWILRTSETRSLTRSATLGIVEDVSNIIDTIVCSLKSQTCRTLELRGIDQETISDLGEIFSGPITKPFEGLSTFRQQLNYYRDNFNLIVSLKCLLYPISVTNIIRLRTFALPH